MLKGLTEYEKFKVIRPIIGECQYDDLGMPIIKKTSVDDFDWETIKVTGMQNISPRNADASTLVLMFNYDKKLLSLWNDPLKKIALFQSYAAVSTPDFSIYPEMNVNEIRHNIFMSRWLGVTWQNYGCSIIPAVGWATPDTFDLCFSGIEPEGVILISTLGCQTHKSDFLNGFEEMKKRLAPELIVVFGEMVDGMTGTFINFKYAESFASKNEQLRITEISRIFTIKEVA